MTHEPDRFRKAMTDSARLVQQDEHERALKLLDESMAEAVREQQDSWVRTLCHHAAVVSNFFGDHDA